MNRLFDRWGVRLPLLLLPPPLHIKSLHCSPWFIHSRSFDPSVNPLFQRKETLHLSPSIFVNKKKKRETLARKGNKITNWRKRNSRTVFEFTNGFNQFLQAAEPTPEQLFNLPTSWQCINVHKWRGSDVFSNGSTREEDDEESLKWAALEKLPTYNCMKKGLFLDGVVGKEFNIDNLGITEKRQLIERLVRVAEEDNERFLLKLKQRIDRWVQTMKMWVK